LLHLVGINSFEFDSLDYFGIKCEDIVRTDLKRHDRMLTDSFDERL